jgi:nucleoside-diphosphate-sugar epimerase
MQQEGGRGMFINNRLYQEDIADVAKLNIDWDILANKSILITGATGLIGSFFIDALMFRNEHYDSNISIYAMSRNTNHAKKRFGIYWENSLFKFSSQDVTGKINLNGSIDYIIHGASNTHPISYATEPINTVIFSVAGTKNILDFASRYNVKRTLFLSTVEIYGENRGDAERFEESYCGYIDCNTLRAGYPEGKRAAEALCQAYINEKKIDVVIARCCRVYGPTMGLRDSKVIAQFLRNASSNQPVVLKSKGTQRYSYCYVADICSAMLIILLAGNTGEAYNISNDNSDLSLSEIATICAEYGKTEVIFDIPSSIETSGYSKATKALLNSAKLRELGWKAKYTLCEGIRRTIHTIKSNGQQN